MLELLHSKKIKEKFKSEFGVSVDDFVENMNSSNLSINLNELKKNKNNIENENDNL
jgi:hypothetical protein